MLLASVYAALKAPTRILPVLLVATGACGDGRSGAHLFESPAPGGGSSSGASSSGGSGEPDGAGTDAGGSGSSGREAATAGKPNGELGGAGSAGSTSRAGSGGGMPTAAGAGTGASDAGSDAGGAPASDECAVSELVTSAVFDQLFPPKTRDAFYTYQAFLEAAAAYPEFGAQGDCDARKRDIAAFFANVARQTARLHYVEQVNQSTACASTVTYAPCAPGKKYFGRGPMQLSWNYNYYAASTCLGLGTSLLTTPDVVAEDAVITWRTGLWFWNTGGANRCKIQNDACATPPDTSSCDSPHRAMTSGRGFGATIDLVNGAIECGDKPDEAAKNAVKERVCFYQDFVKILGTTPGPGELSCGPSVVTCP